MLLGEYTHKRNSATIDPILEAFILNPFFEKKPQKKNKKLGVYSLS